MVNRRSEPDELHIFVNRRNFEEGDGVRFEMTGGQIAALVNVPVENAIVRIESGPNQGILSDLRAHLRSVASSAEGRGAAHDLSAL